MMNYLKMNVPVFVFLISVISHFEIAAKKTIKVACIGDFVTAGYLLANPATNSYPHYPVHPYKETNFHFTE
jgi:sialate O-acetylesterase